MVLRMGLDPAIPSQRTAVALFAQRDFEGLRWFDTTTEATAFADGLRTGARLYGGTAYGYCLPGGKEDLRRDYPQDAERVLKEYEAGLARGRSDG